MVASHAGVSPATVSRVLNGNATVDNELTLRVLSSARALGYKGAPPTNAPATVVFIVPGLGNTYYSTVASGVIDKARELGYRVVTMTSNFSADEELNCLKIACSPDTVGVIITPISGRNPYEALPALRGTPLVITGVRHLADDLTHVCQNYEDSAYISTRYLLRLGRRRIVFLSHFWSDRIHTCEEFLAEYHSCAHGRYSVYDRYTGYCRALAEVGLSPDPELIAFGDYSYESGYRCARKLLSSPVTFDAVLAPNDRVGAGFLNMLREQGILVPQQVSLVCMNGGLISEVISPAMTSVVSKDYELGVAALKQLDNLIKKQPVSNVILNTELAIKSSTLATNLLPSP